ncbi:MAG: CcmD family protein [Chitinophagaceae bacterium]|nr:CcmD family protein [Chitinophagaceae bacterium]
MLKIIQRLLVTVIFLFFNGFIFAQSTIQNTGTVDNVMRSNNKIYVVMAVCVTILLGLILYLIRIDRKVGKAEKHI